MNKILNKLLIFLTLLTVQNTQKIYSSDGTLDTATFNSPNGFITGPSGQGLATVIQTDGKVILAGIDNTGNNFRIARYNTNGTLDTSTTGPAGNARGIAIESDGKIIASGNIGANVIVVRYDTNLAVETTFALISGIGIDCQIQTDGKVVVVGQDAAGNNFLVVRYMVDGTPDPSFGPGGVATGPNPAGFADSVTIQADGKILVAGQGLLGTQIARYNTDGTIDTSFGSGAGFIEIPDSALATSVLVQPDSKILAASFSPFTLNSYVIRLDDTGNPDNSFASSGIFTTNLANINDIVLQPDGKIIGIGISFTISNFNFLIRLTDTGQIDTTFGTAGTVNNPAGRALVGALQVDGKIIAAGLDFTNNLFQVTRYLNNNPLTSTTITEPTNGQIVDETASTISFTGTAQNPSNIFIFLNNSLLTGIVTDPAGSNTWEFTTSQLSPGDYQLQVISFYKDGQVNIASDTINFTVGQIPVPPMPIPVNPTIIPTSASAIVSAILSKYCLLRIGVSS